MKLCRVVRSVTRVSSGGKGTAGGRPILLCGLQWWIASWRCSEADERSEGRTVPVLVRDALYRHFRVPRL
jgi:hypothetical protein